MTINNLERFIASLPDWAILKGCFGDTKISPMDVDGLVERNGTCLFLEKKGPSAFLSDGQAITFRALARQGNMVLTYWALGDDVHKIRIDRAEGIEMMDPATLEDLRSLVSNWFQKANEC